MENKTSKPDTFMYTTYLAKYTLPSDIEKATNYADNVFSVKVRSKKFYEKIQYALDNIDVLRLIEYNKENKVMYIQIMLPGRAKLPFFKFFNNNFFALRFANLVSFGYNIPENEVQQHFIQRIFRSFDTDIFIPVTDNFEPYKIEKLIFRAAKYPGMLFISDRYSTLDSILTEAYNIKTFIVYQTTKAVNTLREEQLLASLKNGILKAFYQSIYPKLWLRVYDEENIKKHFEKYVQILNLDDKHVGELSLPNTSGL